MADLVLNFSFISFQHPNFVSKARRVQSCKVHNSRKSRMSRRRSLGANDELRTISKIFLSSRVLIDLIVLISRYVPGVSPRRPTTRQYLDLVPLLTPSGQLHRFIEEIFLKLSLRMEEIISIETEDKPSRGKRGNFTKSNTIVY